MASQDIQNPSNQSYRSHGTRPDTTTPVRSERSQETPKSIQVPSQEQLERSARMQNFNVKQYMQDFSEMVPYLQTGIEELGNEVADIKQQCNETSEKMNMMYNEIPEMVHQVIDQQIDDLRNFLANQNS